MKNIAIFLLAVFIIIIFSPRGLFLPPSPLTTTANGLPGLASLGTIDRSFDNLLAEIKKDVHLENIEITVVVGPYFQHSRILVAMDSYYAPHYYILIDKEFLNELTAEEKRAAIAHEAGHIMFGPRYFYNRRGYTANEVLSDEFAVKYTHPRHIIGLIDKAYLDYITRKKQLESLDPNP